MCSVLEKSRTASDIKEENELNEETLIRIVELKAEYAKDNCGDESWIKISNELDIDIELCKQSFSETFSSYQQRKNDLEFVDSQLNKLLSRLESSLELEYCSENFSRICRFCCRLRNDSLNMQEIFDDSSDVQLCLSNKLIEKINYTLYGNFLNRADFKLSNLICECCSIKIEELDAFKRRCDHTTQLLVQVKEDLDRLQNQTVDSIVEEYPEEVQEELENEEDEEEFSQSGYESSQDEEINAIEEDGQSENESSKNPIKRVVKKKAKHKPAEEPQIDIIRKGKHYKGKNSQCPICGKLVKGLSLHLLTHSGIRPHKCNYCPKSFTQSGQLKRHINSHLDIRNYKCPEPGCERRFVDPSSVTKHLVVHNKEDRKYQCSLCGSRFNRLGALRYHEKTHRQERNHTCDVCKKSFLAKYDLTKHYRTHTGEKPYSCKYCDKKFSISKNAKVHLRVHTKEKPYACKFCDLSFAYRSSMKNHLIKIHNHADVSSLPLMQVINIAMQSESDQNEIELEPQLNEIESIEGLDIELADHLEATN